MQLLLAMRVLYTLAVTEGRTIMFKESYNES